MHHTAIGAHVALLLGESAVDYLVCFDLLERPGAVASTTVPCVAPTVTTAISWLSRRLRGRDGRPSDRTRCERGLTPCVSRDPAACRPVRS